MTALLEVQNLTRRFGGLVAVNNVSLRVNHGDILGLIGPNGAGKTTVFNLIVGLIRPNTGKVRLQGHDITNKRPSVVSQHGLTKTFQNVALFPEMTVLDNVLVGGLAHSSIAESRALARKTSNVSVCLALRQK